MRSSSTDPCAPGSRPGRGPRAAAGTWLRLAAVLVVGACAAVTPSLGSTSALLTDTDDVTATVTTGVWATPAPTVTETATPTPTEPAATASPGPTADPTATPTVDPAPASRLAPTARRGPRR